ncbi:MAG TPA: MarC family protein [Candidatus Goldiibacteriota bacterium]|nr:MarC family protein [Candidatus Goldiibacteriota bacterium]
MKEYLLAFIPVFVAVDAIGVLPLFIALTKGMSEKARKKALFQSVFTAISLALTFILVGKWLFSVLGITVPDFMIAGGIVLFCIAIMDLLLPGKQRRMPDESIGAVPLGTPLIVGPAVLTTCLIIVDQHGVLPTIASVILNVMIAALIFSFSGAIIRVIGKSGANALSRIMALLLAAIAVMMVRKGVLLLIGN